MFRSTSLQSFTVFGVPSSSHALLLRNAEIASQRKRRWYTGGPEPTYGSAAENKQGYAVWRREGPFQLQLGGVLPELEVAYETWGRLSAAGDNAILLHTGLSASSHAKSSQANPRPGWWERFIGPGAALDTERFFVICTNVLGGCYGTTGPSSRNPATGRPYGSAFPAVTVPDMIHAQMLLLRAHFGVDTLFASVGSSLGGMQSLALACLYSRAVQRLVSISACARSSPSAIAQRYTQRRILMSDPHWNGGDYYSGQYPYSGMQLARQVATISYRSGPEWNERFARKRVAPHVVPGPQQVDFAIEAYLDFQSRKFTTEYDPNSLLYISKAMDLFDLGVSRGHGHDHDTDLRAGLSQITADTLVIGVQSDALFPSSQQREIADHLRALRKPVTYYELDALYGHDTFLIDVRNVGAAIKGHLEHRQSHDPPVGEI